MLEREAVFGGTALKEPAGQRRGFLKNTLPHGVGLSCGNQPQASVYEWFLFAAGAVVAKAGRIRAETFAEQVQLQLESQFQTGNGSQDALYAFVDLDQIIHIGAAQLGGLFDFFVLRFQNAGQSPPAARQRLRSDR